MTGANPQVSSVLPDKPAVMPGSLPQTNGHWVYAFLAVQFGCQLALLVPGLGPFRVIFRTAAFGTSLLWLVLVPGRPRGLESVRTLLLLVMGVVTLSALNPESGGRLASIAHWSFYLAVIGPAFWASRLQIDQKTVEKALLVFWAFYSLSAAAGVLQAAFPGRFQPPLSTVLQERGRDYVLAMSIRLSSGEWILRPMGLTDQPGGAAYGGFYAALLGIGVVLNRSFRGAAVLGTVSVLVGMVCLYLAQVRSLMVMLLICGIALIAVFMISGRISRMAGSLGLFGILAALAFTAALSLGGETVTSRLQTLTEGSAGDVYYRNRGAFLEYTLLVLLPEYPLGAGLGRWGMINAYFGDPAKALWAEIQWTGWVFDGGVVMLMLYPAAVLVVMRGIYVRALSSSYLWLTVGVAYGVGAVALTFGYPVFMATAGIEFWLISSLLSVARPGVDAERSS